MTFLNAALLLGLAAAVIPLLIHLFHRSRFTVVDWAATFLLETVLHTNTRRVRLEQWILLAVRTLAIAGLALCMALPVLTGFRALLREAQTSLVIILDDSYSMAAGQPLQSNFELGRAAADRILAGLRDGSDAAVLLATDPESGPGAEPAHDLALLRQRLGGASVRYAPARIPYAMERAGTLLSGMRHARREVVLITDFQRASWPDHQAVDRHRAGDSLKTMDVPPQVTLFQTDRPAARNVSVESLGPSRRVLGMGQRLKLRANLRNYGLVPEADLQVYFRVDGVEQEAARIDLGPGEAGQLLFDHVFRMPGSHYLEVRVDADPLVADNARLFALPVLERIPVLLLDGDPRPEPLQAETAYLQIALQPHREAGEALTDLIEVRTAAARQFSADNLRDVRVVVAANVERFEGRQYLLLERFVREGGGLLVFLGDRVDPTWYNRTLTGQRGGLLPGALQSLGGGGADPAGVVAEHYDSEALAFFNDPENGSLAGAAVSRWYRLETGPRDQVLAQLDTGDPFLTERSYGEGRVILCATSADLGWGRLPLRPCFLPLVQQLTTYLASTVYPPRNVPAGTPLVLLMPDSTEAKAVRLTTPRGRVTECALEARAPYVAAEFHQTFEPGMYFFETPEGEVVHYVVNSSREESRLERLSEEALLTEADTLGARRVRSHAEYAELDRLDRYGREVWTWLLALVVALLFLELLLEHWFTRSAAAP